MMIISSEDYPSIMRAVHLIQQETGDHLCIPILEVPERWKSFLPRVEAVFRELSREMRAPEEEPMALHIKPNALLDSEFYSFCNGSYEVQLAIANRSLNHILAYLFMTDYFEGWTYTDEGHERNPENMVRRIRLEHLDMLERESGMGLTVEQMRERDHLRYSLT